jgi:putative membrane protein
MMGMTLFWIVPLMLLTFGFFAFLRRTPAKSGHRGGNAETPLEVLRRRYANGEIDSSEYEDRRQRLS